MDALAAHFLVLLSSLAFASAGLNFTYEDHVNYWPKNKERPGKNDDYSLTPGHLCARKCDGTNLICHFNFVIESYSSMGPACGNCPNVTADCSLPQCVTLNGIERPLLTINRMFPGPRIYVCKDDRLIIDVKNKMLDQSTALHWHGIDQRGTPYMDGAPMITQCPILPGQTFRYDFFVPKAGSFFYHSHKGFQKEDGVQGPLIVRDIEGQDFNQNLYTHDLRSHYLFISDMLFPWAGTRFPGTIKTNVGQGPQAFLINGRGLQGVNPPTVTNGQIPMTEFRVEKGNKYRFRIISALCLTCIIEVSIQSHKMTLITTDGGNPVKPRNVSSVSLTTADRFDVVVHANQNIGTYYVFVRGLGACAGRINQYALLRYADSTQDLPPNSDNVLARPVVRFLPNHCNASNPEILCINQLQGAIPPSNEIVENTVKRTIVINIGFHFSTVSQAYAKGQYPTFFIPASNPVSGPLLAKSLLNNISFVSPTTGPMLSRHCPRDELCPQKCYEGYGDSENCNCVNRYKVPLGSTLFLIVADTASFRPFGLVHPLHLHGYDSYIVETGYFQKDRESSLKEIIERLNSDGIENPSPTLKDVIGVPSGGYVIIAIHANNPGFWLMHCHFIYHSETGMTAILQTGERHQMPPPPPNFPICHNFKTPIEDMH